MAKAYLDINPPKTRQFRPRVKEPTGLLVIHTAESPMDTVGADEGAENVARFIQNRTDKGSYHRLVDSDSIVPLVRLSQAAYGDGTGSNDIAVHIAFADKTTDWAKMSRAREDAFLRNGAKAAAEAIRWLRKNYGIDVPSERITKAESDAGKPGFLGHGDRDPGRRSDPGADFDWERFLGMVDEELGRAEAKPKSRGPRIDKALDLSQAALKTARRSLRGIDRRRQPLRYAKAKRKVENLVTAVEALKAIPKK